MSPSSRKKKGDISHPLASVQCSRAKVAPPNGPLALSARADTQERDRERERLSHKRLILTSHPLCTQPLLQGESFFFEVTPTPTSRVRSLTHSSLSLLTLFARKRVSEPSRVLPPPLPHARARSLTHSSHPNASEPPSPLLSPSRHYRPLPPLSISSCPPLRSFTSHPLCAQVRLLHS